MKSSNLHHLLSILETTQELVITLDLNQRLTYANPYAQKLLSIPNFSAAKPVTFKELVAASCYENFQQQIVPQLHQGNTWQGELNLELASGVFLPLKVTWLPKFAADASQNIEGDLKGFSAICTDLRNLKSYENAQRLSIRIFESTIEGIMITDGRARIQKVNAAFTEITGYTSEEVLGETPRILRSEHHDAAFYKNMWDTIAAQDTWQGEIWNRRKDGSVYLQWLSLSCIRDQQGDIENYVSVIHDLSELRAKEARIQHLSQHDILTGLGNRHLLNSRLEQAVRQAKIQNEEMALLLIDLGQIATLNETYGHTFSDNLIRVQSSKIALLAHEADTLVRTGADEFALLIENYASTHDITQLACSIKDALQKPAQVDSKTLTLSPSIGAAFFPTDGLTADALLANAQTALRDAKSSGRNVFKFFDPSLGEEARHRLSLEQALRGAINGEGLSLHFQPKVRLVDESICGVEALLRWQHPELGPMSPAVFIPLAEEAGLIKEIGAWVIEEACRCLVRWQELGLNLPRVAINVAVQQLEDKDLPVWLEKTLHEYGLSLDNFELEITETGLMENEACAISTLDVLQQKGFRLALDDFGTGYSSLSYLRKLPLSTLKIDRAFINDMNSNDVSLSIVQTIVQLAHNLKLDLVAEGIEEEHQARQLLAMGCQLAQGFLYYRPLPEAELIQLLKS